MYEVDPNVVWWTIAVITLPGFLLGWVSGLRIAWAVAAAIPLSFSLYGLAGWLLGLTSQDFGVGSTAVIFVIALVVALVWRLVAWMIGHRRELRRADAEDDTPRAGPIQIMTRTPLTVRLRNEGQTLLRALIPGVAVLGTATWVIIATLGWLENTPWGARNIVQGWDSQWHANVVRWIVEEGDASATHMGELQNVESMDTVYYPVAFHAAAALVVMLSHTHPIEAFNIMSIVAPSLGLPLSVALIAWFMVGNRGVIGQIGAGMAAILSAGVPALLWIGHYVGFFPYMTAMAVSGIVAVLFMSAPARPVMSCAAALSLTGLTQLHPAAVTVPVLMVVLWWLLHLVWKPARRSVARGWPAVRTRLRDLLILAGTGVTGVLILLPQLLVGSGQAEEVAGWSTPDAKEGAEAWSTAVTMTTRHVGDFFPTWDATVLLWLAAAGGLVVVVWFRNLWAPVFYLLSLVLTVHVLDEFEFAGADLLTLVTGVHYNTAHRLVWPVGMLTCAAAGIAIATIIRLLTGGPVAVLVTQRRETWQKGTAIAAVLVSIPVAVGMANYVKNEADPGAREAFQVARTSTRMVSQEDLAAWDWLAEQPRAYDGLIAGEAADGMGWMYAYNGLPSLYRHYQWPSNPREAATERLYWNADLLDAGLRGDPDAENPVDEAAEELGVAYIYLSPPSFWAHQRPQPALSKGLWTSSGTTPVYRDGNLVIFAVDSAFTEDELAEVMTSGAKHSPDPIPTIPPAEVAESDSAS